MAGINLMLHFGSFKGKHFFHIFNFFYSFIFFKCILYVWYMEINIDTWYLTISYKQFWVQVDIPKGYGSKKFLFRRVIIPKSFIPNVIIPEIFIPKGCYPEIWNNDSSG